MRKIAALAFASSLALAAPAQAAITLGVNGTATGNAPSVTGLNTTGNTLFGACVSADNSNGTGQTVSDNKGNSWTRLVRVAALGSNQLEFWYSLPTTVGASTSITYSGNFSTIQAITFSGTATSSVLDGTVTSNSAAFNTSIQPGSITPSQANGVLITCLALDAGAATDVASGFTVTNDVAGGEPAATAYLIQTSAAAANPTWSGHSSTTALTAMQAFKDPGGGGGGSSTVPLRGLLGVGQ